MSRNNHEKNWVQVTTAPTQSEKDTKDTASTDVQQKSLQTEIPSTQETTFLPEAAPSIDKQPAESAFQKLQNDLQHEKNLNRRQANRIKELFAQVLSLQASSDDATARLEEIKEPAPQVASALSNGTENNQLTSIKKSLLAKMDAFDKANARISSLADRLDQTRLTVAELQNSNNHLQDAFTEAEAAKIKAFLKAESYLAELNQTRNDKEKYLAETGRLNAELQQTRTRLAYTDNELNKAKRKSSAMLRYGQEQDELITPFRQQIEVLNARVQDKNKELLESEDLTVQLMEQKQDLQEEIKYLQLDQQKNKVAIEELKNTSQILVQEKEHSAKLSEQLKVIADQLNTRDQKITTLQTDLTQSQTILNKAKQHSELLQKKNEEQQQELAMAAQNLQKANKQRNEATTEQRRIQKDLDKAQTDVEQLVMQLAAQKKLLEKVKTESAQLAVTLEQKNKQLVGVPKMASSKTLKQPSNPVHGNKDALAKANETIRQLKLALQAAEKRLSETSHEAQQLKHSLADTEIKQADTSQTDRLQKEITRLENDIAEKNSQQKELHLRITDLEEKIRSTENNVKKLKELETLLAHKTKELETKQNFLRKMEQDATDLSTELDRRESDYFNLQEEFSLLQNRHDALQKERDNLFLYSLNSDNDTVSDATDTCPETVAGTEVGPDGCEMDIDGDGIVDRLDLCPDTAPRSAINTLGCAPGAPIVLTGLYFSGGNSELSPASQTYLDEVITALESMEITRFEVGGHTDSIGDIDRNQQVSRLRAEAVSNYLINKGFDAERLESVGYGSAQPVADNSTAEGRSVNRRVELKILSPGDQTSSREEDEPTANAEEVSLPTQ